jgi:hypothetical protein
MYGLPTQPVVAGGWQRGTYWVNRTEWPVNSEGRPKKLRAWNSRTGQYTWFPAGRDNPDDLTGDSDVPVAANNLAVDEDNLDNLPLIRMSVWGQGRHSRTIPLIPDGDDAYRRPARAGREDLGLVRDQDHSQQDIEEALRRSVPEILRSYPRVRTADGMKHIIAIESKVVWCWNEDREITFDEQIFRHIYSQETPTIETLLDRPLLGLPYIDELMYGRQGLSKLALLDLTDRSGCVVAQIYEFAEKDKRIRDRYTF